MPTPALTANSPTSGSIAWTAFVIQYGGQAFPIAAGNTANRFVWWLYNAGAGGPLQSSNLLPETLGADDLLLFINKSGVPINAQAATIVEGSIISKESIVGDSIAANTITGAKIMANEISAREIAANTITADEIQAGGITAAWFAAGTVVTELLGASKILASHIGANQITAGQIAANTITAGQIAANTITAGQIASNAVTADEIAANTITAGEIQAGGITADWFAATSVVADLVGADVILSNHIGAGEIKAGNIAADAVTADKVAAGAITTNKLSVTVGGGNLLRNSAFRDGLNNYQVRNAAQSSVTVVSDPYLGETYAAKLKATVGGADIGIHAERIPVVAGDKITFSYYARKTGTGGTNAGLEFFDASGAYISGQYPGVLVNANGTYRRNVHSFTIPTGAAFCAVMWYTGNSVAQDEHFYKMAQVEVGDLATAYSPKADEILPGTIVAAMLAADSVTATQIKSGSITASEIQTGGISADWFAAGTISAQLIGATTILSNHIGAGQIKAGNIDAKAVTAGKIDTDAVTATEIKAGSITASEIQTQGITADWFAVGSVLAKILTADLILAEHIGAGEITANEIDSQYVYAGAIQANQIQAGYIETALTVSGRIETAGTGRRVVMDDKGLHLLDANAKPIIDLPTNATESATFKGNATMNTATIEGGLSIKKPPLALDGSQPLAATIQPGASIELANGVQPPGTPPTPTVSLSRLDTFGTISLSGVDSYPWYANGLHIDNGYAYVAMSAGDGQLRVHKVNLSNGDAAANWSPNLTTTQIPAGYDKTLLGITKIGTYYYLAYLATNTSSGGTYRVTRFTDGTFQTQVGGADAILNAASEQLIGIATDGTYLYIGYLFCDRNSEYGPFRVRKVDPTTMATVAGGVYTESTGLSFYNYAEQSIAAVPTGMAVGNLDYGSERFVIYDRSKRKFRTYTLSATTLTEQANESWPDNEVGGACWDGYNFWQVQSTVAKGAASMKLERYSKTKWTTESSTWWASYAWLKTGAPEKLTPASPAKQFTMTKRRYLTLAGEDVPISGAVDDPNSARHYLQRGATEPTRTAMWAIGDGVSVNVPDTYAFAGTAVPVATSTFSASASSDIHSGAKRADQKPKNRIGSDGTANLDGLIPPGSIQMFGGSTAPAGWLLCDGTVYNNATYPDLVSAIGNSFGGSAGASTFAVPDMRSKFPMGANPTVGATGGSTTSTIAATNLPPHVHPMPHDHGLDRSTATGTVNATIPRGTSTVAQAGATGAIGQPSNANTSNGSTTGLNGTPLDVLNPYLGLSFIIKT